MKQNVSLPILITVMVVLVLLMAVMTSAQPGVFSKDALIRYTPQWKGERFPDGRPKVPDEVLEKMKGIVIDDAILVLKKHGFNNQYDDRYVSNQDKPRLVGRAVTCTFMPVRPDVNSTIDARAEKDGIKGSPSGKVVDTLVVGDVVVADMWGEITNTFAGGNISGRINKMTGGTGIVINGGCLDKEEITATVPNFTIYVRGWHPTHLHDVMLMGLNCPIRMGQASVMPGDVVLGGYEGVLFIPAHLAQEIVDTYGK